MMGPAARRARSGAAPPAQPGAAPPAQPGAAPEAASESLPGPPPGTEPGLLPGELPEAAPDATPEPAPNPAAEATPEPAPNPAVEAAPDVADLLPGTPGAPWPGLQGTRTAPWTQGPDPGSVPPLPGGALRARLASDPRKFMWIQRAVASAVAGIIVSALADWRLGLTAAVAIAIADTVHRSRTTAAIPAGVRAPSAHRRTRRRLARLDRAGYRALHARAVPGRQFVIDHLVVGPGGVCSVGSE